MNQIIYLILIVIILPYSHINAKNGKVVFPRDPFNPNPINKIETKQNFSETSFKVTGIIWDKDNPSAVIQFPRFKKIVYVGNSINNYKINTITKKYIELTTSSNKIMVKLGEEKIFE